MTVDSKRQRMTEIGHFSWVGTGEGGSNQSQIDGRERVGESIKPGEEADKKKEGQWEKLNLF